ncbi:MAG: NFACT family protein [Negativicutes bacterium]|nr:NFACT family protein [Negativicutes bacterium]
MSLDGLSMSLLTAELGKRLAGGRVDRIFQFNAFELLIWIRQPGENLRLLLSAHPEHARMHLTGTSPDNPASPPPFCMLLRKHLEDGRISAVKQHGLDRIITIGIDVRGEHGLIVTKELTAEIMGKHSNIILTQDGIILDSIRRIGPSQSRYRHILPGRPYVSPPSQDRLNPLTASPVIFMETAIQKTGLLEKAIIYTGLGMGPVTAREIIHRAGLPATVTTAQASQKINRLAAVFEELLAPLKAGNHEPTVALGPDKRLLAVAAFPLTFTIGGELRSFVSMSEAVEFADAAKGIRQTPEKQFLCKLVAGEIAKLQRKETLLIQELAEAETAEDYRRKADILMAFLHDITRETTQAVLPDIYSEAPYPSLVTISLDPSLSPVENANGYYQRYNKLKRAQASLARQLHQTREETAYLEGVLLSLEQAETAEDVSDIRHELVAAGYIQETGKRRAAPSQSAPLCYLTSDGFEVLVGKNNRQNDQLTLKQAQPEDIWLHTKDIPGSHVILRTAGREPSIIALQQAAMLAAYYSKARQSAKVPVDYAKRRYVRKPSGAKPGFVIYDHNNTLYVTPNEETVKRLASPKK